MSSPSVPIPEPLLRNVEEALRFIAQKWPFGLPVHTAEHLAGELAAAHRRSQPRCRCYDDEYCSICSPDMPGAEWGGA